MRKNLREVLSTLDFYAALLLAVGGARVVIAESVGLATRFLWRDRAILVAGGAMVLYTFLASSLSVLPADASALAAARPSPFEWPLYLAGFASMAYAVFSGTRSKRSRSRQLS